MQGSKMTQDSDNFTVESTPVFDFNKQSFKNHSEQGLGPAGAWDADRTEVYADIDEADAVATLVSDTGSTYPISTFPFVIGRGNECDLVLQGKGVSRKHAEIVFQSGRFVVNDMESLNGIKVNGYKIARVILEENDVIKLGEVSLTFHSGEEEGGSTGSSADRFSGVQSAADDNTFGPSPLKKVFSAIFALVAVGLLAASGYLYYTKNLQSNASGLAATAPADVRGNDVAEKSVSPNQSASGTDNSATNSVSAVNQAASSTQDTPPPTSAIAPPPSLAMSPKPAKVESAAPAPKVDKPVEAPAKPSTPKVAAVTPASKPVASPAPKPKQAPLNLNSQAEASRITAQNLYIQGSAPGALQELKKYIGNAAVSTTYQNSVKQTYGDLDSLYSQFTNGQKAYASGDKDLAFSIWTQFMAKEASILNGQKSSYSRSIATRVTDEYVERGNQASNEGDYHKAYDYWKKAIALGDSVSAKIALDNLENKARQLYRQALRLEYVNTKKAKAMWLEVTQLLPPGTEYNTKASAKLAWYEKWGS